MLRIGHRGAAGHAPENTLLSIETALRLGVDVVEIDVHRSRDGHIVVMHDERIDRTTTGKGYIRDLTLEQLKALGVPTLREVLGAVRGRAALMIEIKARHIVGDIVPLVAAAPGIEIYYASFLHSELLHLSEAKTIALIDAVPVHPSAFALDAKATIAGVAFSCLEPRFVQDLHDTGISVFTWTVDDPRDIDLARSLHVEGIISNFPERLR